MNFVQNVRNIKMKFPIYAVRAILLGFGLPVIRDNDAVASRAFEFDCNRDDSQYKIHPEHFQLYFIADYDTDDGSILGFTPRLIASATDFIVKE